MKTNKKMWLGIGCGVLVVALVVGIILMAGGNGKQPNPTNPTNPSSTTPSSNVTEPSGTEPTVGPDEPDWGSDELPGPTGPIVRPPEFEYDDPIDPPEGGTDVEIIPPPEQGGNEEPSDPTEPTDDPTFSGGSYDSGSDEDAVIDPKPTNPVPTPTPTPTPTPDPDPEYDFTGITVGNITYEQWKSWDQATRQAFRNATSLEDATLDERYNFHCATEFQGGYDCGYENHYCVSKSGHNKLVDAMAEGCPYCGEHDCVSFYSRDNRGITKINYEKCPKYHNNCKVCGLPESPHDVESGEAYCNKYLKDTNCHECGEPVKAGECHREIKP